MLCWILIVGGLLIMMGQHDRSEALFYYFRVEDQTGLRFWLYRDGLYDREIEQREGEIVSPKWFVHGLFA